MLALLGVDESDQPDFAEDVLSTAARNATQLLDDIELTEQNAGLSKLSESLPSATKILQTPDQYAISTEQFVTQSAEWKGDSSHLWSGVRLLERSAYLYLSTLLGWSDNDAGIRIFWKCSCADRTHSTGTSSNGVCRAIVSRLRLKRDLVRAQRGGTRSWKCLGKRRACQTWTMSWQGF